jgi:pimeloyl-ACP methyl ester carboxylesterase
MNASANMTFAQKAKAHWQLKMPVLFLHATNDHVCESIESRLAEPMRKNCSNLTEAIVSSGHWMAQEKPTKVNAALARWLGVEMPDLWAR